MEKWNAWKTLLINCSSSFKVYRRTGGILVQFLEFYQNSEKSLQKANLHRFTMLGAVMTQNDKHAQFLYTNIL